MLRTRVLTALVLLPLVLGLVFAAPPRAWGVFATALALVSAWEWSRLCGFGEPARRLYLAASAAIGAGFLVLHASPAGDFGRYAEASFITAAGFWAVAVPMWLGLRLRPRPCVSGLAGVVVIWPMAAALVTLRAESPWVLLAAAALVWIADIAAYFAGRAFGRHKLAPAVSPGKTWEGVAGALAAVLAYGVLLALFAAGGGSPLARLFSPLAGVPAVAALLVLAALSVAGDLFESWMKRGAGRKDSSALLPGHGGVLDRIDALTPTLPVAALLAGLA